MIKGKLKKTAAGILAAAMVITTCTAASLYADSQYKEENKTDIMSEEDGFGTDPEESDVPEPVTEDTQTEESSEEETQTQYTETEPAAEETPETPSESEPPIPDETTAPSTTKSTGSFFVPTEPPSTAAPIIIILVEPGYVPPETTTAAPIPSDPFSFETAAHVPSDPFSFETPIPAQTDASYIPPTVNKYVRASENVPAVKILTDGEELLDAVADPFEKAWLSDVSEVDIILSVNNGNGIKDSDKELIKAAAANAEPDVKYSVGEYLDISLLKNIKGEEIGISEAYKEITLTVEIPQNIKDPSGTYGLVRLHNGTAALLKDMDSDPDTITVQTDLFSVYAIVYTKDKSDVNIKTANTLDCLNIFLSVTSVSVILCSFVTLYALWRRKNSKSSKSK